MILCDEHVLTLSQQVSREVIDPYYIDGQDSTHSKWMSFINTDQHEGEQNIIEYNYLGNVYCHTFKSIYPASELLGAYGMLYAQELGTETKLKVNHLLRLMVF